MTIGPTYKCDGRGIRQKTTEREEGTKCIMVLKNGDEGAVLNSRRGKKEVGSG
jgi:hypothetical protein